MRLFREILSTIFIMPAIPFIMLSYWMLPEDREVDGLDVDTFIEEFNELTSNEEGEPLAEEVLIYIEKTANSMMLSKLGYTFAFRLDQFGMMYKA